MSTQRVFSRASVSRIVLDLLAEEVGRSRHRSAAALGVAGWSDATRGDADGLDLDSLERLDVAAALTEFFHLHEYGAEDYLLAMPSVGEWCDLIEQSLSATGTHLTFRTSGSTGTPKRCTHAVADLQAEAAVWADMLGEIPAIVALVPSHHIYGTLFTAMLPDRMTGDCRVERSMGGAVAAARAGSVVVGTPTLWAHLARSVLAFPPGLTGISSTAPLSAQLAHQLAGQRLSRMIEIYGSSETGGVAMRTSPVDPFMLLSGWSRGEAGGLQRLAADGSPLTVAMPDDSEWLDDRRFGLRGRRDGAVQIGGRNVFPERVRDVLLAHAGVADAAVRLEAETGRLKAFIVPQAGLAEDRLVDELDRWCGERVTDVERPRRFAIGFALPMSAMGKPADW